MTQFLFFISLAAVTGLAAWHYRSRQEHRNYGGPTDIVSLRAIKLMWLIKELSLTHSFSFSLSLSLQGFILHVLSACSEYLGGFFYILFFLTFHPDFQRIHVDLHIRSRHHHGDIDGQTVINENTPLNYWFSKFTSHVIHELIIIFNNTLNREFSCLKYFVQ